MEFLCRSREGVTTKVLIMIYRGMRDLNQVFPVQNLDYLFKPEYSTLRAEEGIIFLVLAIISSLFWDTSTMRAFLKISRGFSKRVRSRI